MNAGKISALSEYLQIHCFTVPFDWQTAAGQQTTGDWFKIVGDTFAVVAIKGAGTAGDDPTLTIQQATDNAGTSAKALNFQKIVRMESVAANMSAVTTRTVTTQAAANTYTNLTSAESSLIWIVDFETSDMDADGGFNHVNATIADVGSNAQLGTIILVQAGLWYGGVASGFLDETA